jgi:hypothetical protein
MPNLRQGGNCIGFLSNPMLWPRIAPGSCQPDILSLRIYDLSEVALRAFADFEGVGF